MDKNVKIDKDTHKRISMLAAETGIAKGELVCVLLNAAMDTLTIEQVLHLVTSHDPKKSDREV